ncbi:hypothetical protein [Roseiterribacter gracilis]|uniref:Uncharacterized protein n=1 Tax=Roseiterribacter gracilis TaxID=2812848 RepID=A0A8S8X9Y4_9PROT|nr:hypothetical protein TMPK1_02670 [Rhodospirillales bacterium TMPK1]
MRLGTTAKITKAQLGACENAMRVTPGFLTGKNRRSPTITKILRLLHEKLDEDRGYAFLMTIAIAGLIQQVSQDTGKNPTLNGLLRSQPNKRSKTLTLACAGKVYSLRTLYERLHNFAVLDLARPSVPYGPQQATESWPDFKAEMQMVLGMTPTERATLILQILSLLMKRWPPITSVNTASFKARPFTTLLAKFPISTQGERHGAMMQAIAYGYYRADAPNLALETAKSRAGGKRTQRVGDIDGYSGRALALSVEVKALRLLASHQPQMQRFLNALAMHKNTTAVVVASDFEAEYRRTLESRGLSTISLEELQRSVKLWDMPKQIQAVRGVWYFLNRVERKPEMQTRLEDFIASRFSIREVLG